MTESNRQKKIAGVLQNDLANVLQKLVRDAGQTGIIISVSKVDRKSVRRGRGVIVSCGFGG